MSVVHKSAGTLTFACTFSTGLQTCAVNISEQIPKQNIYLENVRIQYDTQAHALDQKILYVDLPWLGSAQLVDGRPNFSQLPLLVDNAVVTIYKPNLELGLQSSIPSKFNVKIMDRDGTNTLSQYVTSLTLQFNYGRGYII